MCQNNFIIENKQVIKVQNHNLKAILEISFSCGDKMLLRIES